MRWPGMVGRFQFNNIESDDFDLVCKSIQRPLLPAVKTKRIDITGLSGAYDFDDDECSIRTIRMRIAYIGDNYEELRTRARAIAAWLSPVGMGWYGSVSKWTRLIIHDEPDKYYLAKVTSEIDLQTFFEAGYAEIVFDCQPFAYSISESWVNFLAIPAKEEIFVNPGTRLINYGSPYGSRFKIRVEGSWTAFSLAMNGKVLNYTEPGFGVAMFDNLEMEVFFADYNTLLGDNEICFLMPAMRFIDGDFIPNPVNMFSKLTGDIDTFLHIIPGSNTLAVWGTDLNVQVTIDFIPLWV